MKIKKKLAVIAAGVLTALAIPAFANLPYFPVNFPRDDAAHHDNVPYPVNQITEWWYYNGKLTSVEGRKFAYFVAVFHLDMELAAQQKSRGAVVMVQVMDLDQKKVYGKEMIYPDDAASFSTQQLVIQIGSDFSLNANGSHYYLTEAIADDKPDIKFNLTYTKTRPPLLINKTGLLDMWDNTNSYYYSNTRLKTEGTIQIGNDVITINPDESSSWMDHQWGDFTLDSGKAQWIWTSSQLDNDMDLSVFELINPQTRQPIWGLANVIMPDGSYAYTKKIKMTPSNDGSSGYPQTYDIEVKPLNMHLTLDSMVPDQDSNGFWEGIHETSGLYGAKAVKGYSFVENTVHYK